MAAKTRDQNKQAPVMKVCFYHTNGVTLSICLILFIEKLAVLPTRFGIKPASPQQGRI
jgi:hypothetical protein